MYRGCPKYPGILSTPGSVHCVLVGTYCGMYRGCPKYPGILSTPGSVHCVLVGTYCGMYRGCPKYPWILSTPGSVHCVLVCTVGCTEDVLSIPGCLVHRDQYTACWCVLWDVQRMSLVSPDT